MIDRKFTATLPAMILTLTSLLVAADTDTGVLNKSGSLERLIKKSGVYNASRTGRTPGFVIDPAWPQPLPNNCYWARSGGSMSTSMTMSGSTTGRAL